MNELEIGSTLGDEFKIVKCIGSGSFGITYKVEALRDIAPYFRSGEHYVVKECFAQNFVMRATDGSVTPIGSTPEKRLENAKIFDRLKEKFIAEANALSLFQHPNIVAVYGLREGNFTAYMVMEHIDGSDLEKAIRSHFDVHGKGISGQQVEILLKPLLDGLAEVHRHGLVHRDIKPANIMLRRADEPVLIDFGGAVPLEDADRSVVLTPDFAPHDQRVGKNISERTDIYSLAATFYFALTGQLPVLSRDGQIALNHRLSVHPNLASMQISTDLASGLDQALNYYEPDARPNSVIKWCDILFPMPAALSNEGDAPERVSVFDSLELDKAQRDVTPNSVSEMPNPASEFDSLLPAGNYGSRNKYNLPFIGLGVALLVVLAGAIGVLSTVMSPNEVAVEQKSVESIALAREEWTPIKVPEIALASGTSQIGFRATGRFRIKVDGTMYTVMNEGDFLELPPVSANTILTAKAVDQPVVLDMVY